MHKAILMLLLAVMSGSAMAKWVGINATEKSNFYADPTTIRKSGNIVKMWRLTDFSTVQEAAGKKYLSSKSQDEYDCKEEQIRTFLFIWYSENMGRGDVVYSKNKPNLDWTPVIPESKGKFLWKIACGKTSATAEWTKVDFPSLPGETLYVDLTTIRKSGNKVEMWHMLDIESIKAGEKLQFSMRVKNEHDCKEEKSRALSMTMFRGNMGTGAVIKSVNKPRNWVPVEPDSYKEVFWKIACDVTRPAAKWVEAVTTNKATLYIDTATIRKSGNKAKMWSLEDFKAVQETEMGKKKLRYLSSKHQWEFNCKENQLRMLAFVGFSDNMSRGTRLSTLEVFSSDSGWMHVEELGEPSGTLWKTACRK